MVFQEHGHYAVLTRGNCAQDGLFLLIQHILFFIGKLTYKKRITILYSRYSSMYRGAGEISQTLMILGDAQLTVPKLNIAYFAGTLMSDSPIIPLTIIGSVYDIVGSHP